jgi:excisionase family DNA binding protein
MKTQQQRTQRLLSIQQAADRLGLSPATLRAWRFRSRTLQFIKIGGAIRVSEEAVENLIQRGIQATRTEV